MTAGPYDDEGDDGGPERPSKSARKRAAHAAQDLGEQLLRLPESQLATIENLPEELRDALRAARRINSRAAAVRQRQYIGKLMRQVDPEPIRAALAARSARDARETERFRRIENWRERLISEGEPALQELAQWHPAIDVSAWRQRIDAARAERQRTAASGAASRELFRALRAFFATMPT